MTGNLQAQVDAQIDAAASAYFERDRTLPIELQVSLWNDLWHICDFSWNGLKDIGADKVGEKSPNFAQRIKRWSDGSTLKSIQDYWRQSSWQSGKFQRTLTDDEMLSVGLLVEKDGVLWHPLFIRDGLVSLEVWKAVQDRLEAATTQTPGLVPLLLMGTRASQLSRSLFYDTSTNQTRTVAIRTSLAEYTNWSTWRINFSHDSDFSGCMFVGESQFFNSKFGSNAEFYGSLFLGNTFFHKTVFGEGARMDMSLFAKRANFTEAEFGRHSSFRGVQFWESAQFTALRVEENASFREAEFRAGAHFSQAKFGKDLSFYKAQFKGRATFYRSSFNHNTSFEGAGFFEWAGFSETEFDGLTSFNYASFENKVDFRAADFRGHAGFAECTWPVGLQNQRRALQGCRFRDVADFRTERLSAFALFDGAEFKGRLLLTDPGKRAEDACFSDALKSTEAAAKEIRERIGSQSLNAESPDAAVDTKTGLQVALASWVSERSRVSWSTSATDQAFASLAGGLRTLKQAMSTQGDREREQRFFRYEVQARAKRPSEGQFSKLAARAYGMTSNYGMSVGLPVVWITGLVVAFSIAFLAFGLSNGSIQGKPSYNEISQAIELSAANSFRPFSILETPSSANESFWVDVLQRNDEMSLIMRMVGIVQSIFTVILIFLVGLALKRKFQVG